MEVLAAARIIIPILLLSACTASGEQISQKRAGRLEFFNAFYSMPASTLNQSCVIDAKLSHTGEGKFLSILSSIAENTGNDILYSDPVKRDRYVYVAPVRCDSVNLNNYSPSKYFRESYDVIKVNAEDYEYILTQEDDHDLQFIADLERAAFSAELDLGDPSSRRRAKEQIADTFCILNENLKAQRMLGLPFLLISVRDNSLIYIYNTKPEGVDLIRYLLARSFKACGVNYAFDIRNLNAVETTEFKKLFSKHSSN